jgi:hypothetical protein
VVQPIERRSWRRGGAVGGGEHQRREMAEWMRLHLGEPGVHRGVRLLSGLVMREMHARRSRSAAAR